MAFLDLSGFTKLTEALESRGRSGAEEITAIVNRLFTPMVRGIEAADGDILKFGGDAILALFDGPDHQSRALEALRAVRSQFRERAAVRTSIGVVRLGMSLSAATGPVELFELRAAGRRELVACGETVRRTARLEAAASGGRFLVDAELARVAGVEHLPVGEGFELAMPAGVMDGANGRPAPRKTLREGLRAGTELVEFLAGPSLGPLVAANGGTAPPEYRQVAVFFDNFRFPAGLPVDERFSAYDGYFSAAATIIFRAGGIIDKVDLAVEGEKLMAIFGAPFGSAEDDERALEAAHALREAGRRLPGLEQRIGVNSGIAVASDLGAPQRRQYTVMGDAVNLAARLMGAAGPGEIVVGATTLVSAGSRFRLGPPERILVKGKRSPVEAKRLIERADGETDGLVLALRHDEQERACREATRLGAGELDVLLLIGSAGSGADAVLAATADGLAGRIVRVAPGFGTVGEPFSFVRDVVLALAGLDVDADVRRFPASSLARGGGRVATRALALVLKGRSTSPGFDTDPRSVIATLADAVSRLAAEPTTLVIRDLHRADAGSRKAIAASLRTAGTALRLFASADSAAAVPEFIGLGTEIGFLPFDVDRLESALRRRYEARPSPDLVRQLLERGQGSAYSIADLLTQLEGRGELPVVGGMLVSTATSPPMPRSVEARAHASIDRLPPGARSLLLELAAFGERIPRAAVTGLFDAEGTRREGIDRLVKDGILARNPSGGLAFTSPVLRAAADGILLTTQRRRIHRRIADWLANEGARTHPSPALVAHHRCEARMPAAGEAALAAARGARSICAYSEAADWFRRAEDALLRSKEERKADATRLVEARLGLAEALRQGGRSEEARVLLRKAMRTAHRIAPELLPRLNVELGFAEMRLGRAEAALRALERGRMSAEERGQRREVALAFRGIGQVHQNLRGDFRAAEAPFRAFLGLARRIGDIELLGPALVSVGYLAFVGGHLPRAAKLLDEAIRLARRHGDLATLGRALTARAHLHTRLGQLGRARRDAEGACAAYGRLGDRPALSAAHQALVMVDLTAGRFESALRTIDQAAAYERTSGNETYESMLETLRGTTLLLSGRITEALVSSQRALEMATRLSNTDGILMATCNLGIAQLAHNDPASALDSLTRAAAAAAAAGSGDALAEIAFYGALAARRVRHTPQERALSELLQRSAHESTEPKLKMFAALNEAETASVAARAQRSREWLARARRVSLRYGLRTELRFYLSHLKPKSL